MAELKSPLSLAMINQTLIDFWPNFKKDHCTCLEQVAPPFTDFNTRGSSLLFNIPCKFCNDSTVSF